ncbi:hypothetical protein [Mesobacillus maritimus]|uniref:DUF4386 domain-containing protein n=1 Tax=Mesobacillus maritimus TaxID=1643336 RepID=A0ABS7K7K4_9BACI|nr:hypothetical protein [Mesobacillus maritimus]MBY0098204.1 hypothetical protein [Mesobacillus maritimus]
MVELKRFSLLRFYKISGIIGCCLYILHGIAFAYSHGTTPQNRELPIFGVPQATALTAIALSFCLCFWFSLFGLKKEVQPLGKVGKWSLTIAQLSFIALFVSGILQNVVIDPTIEWDSTIGIIGWLLQVLAWHIFAVEMVILSIVSFLTKRSNSLLFLSMGIVALLSFHSELMIYTVSTGTLFWDIIHALLYFPFGIIWFLMIFKIEL